MLYDCGIDIIALFCIGIGFGAGYWWIHHLMKKIIDSHRFIEYRKCKKHKFKLTCTKCGLIIKGKNNE